MLEPYCMLLVVQGSCSVLHHDALGLNKDIGRCQVSIASDSIGSANFDRILVVFMVVRMLWYFLVCGGGACVLARHHGNWIGTKPLGR